MLSPAMTFLPRLVVAALLLVSGTAASAAATAKPGPAVRRWEHVLLVRMSDRVPDALGRVLDAASRGGGAVLANVRTVAGPDSQDYRLLVRTRDPGAIVAVMREIRRQSGVVGASVIRLPETATAPGGPSFLTSYTGELEGKSHAGEIVVHRDVPPVLDMRDLAETAPVPAGPSMSDTQAIGGFTLNVSEMVQRAKVAAWVRREDKLRRTPIVILPSGPQEEETPAVPRAETR